MKPKMRTAKDKRYVEVIQDLDSYPEYLTQEYVKRLKKIVDKVQSNDASQRINAVGDLEDMIEELECKWR